MAPRQCLTRLNEDPSSGVQISVRPKDWLTRCQLHRIITDLEAPSPRHANHTCTAMNDAAFLHCLQLRQHVALALKALYELVSASFQHAESGDFK